MICVCCEVPIYEYSTAGGHMTLLKWTCDYVWFVAWLIICEYWTNNRLLFSFIVGSDLVSKQPLLWWSTQSSAWFANKTLEQTTALRAEFCYLQNDNRCLEGNDLISLNIDSETNVCSHSWLEYSLLYHVQLKIGGSSIVLDFLPNLIYRIINIVFFVRGYFQSLFEMFTLAKSRQDLAQISCGLGESVPISRSPQNLGDIENNLGKILNCQWFVPRI